MVLELWTTTAPFRPPANYKLATSAELATVIPDKRRSHFYRTAAYVGEALTKYNKAVASAAQNGGVHVEDVENPLFVHRCSLRYMGAELWSLCGTEKRWVRDQMPQLACSGGHVPLCQRWTHSRHFGRCSSELTPMQST